MTTAPVARRTPAIRHCRPLAARSRRGCSVAARVNMPPASRSSAYPLGNVRRRGEDWLHVRREHCIAGQSGNRRQQVVGACRDCPPMRPQQGHRDNRDDQPVAQCHGKQEDGGAPKDEHRQRIDGEEGQRRVRFHRIARGQFQGNGEQAETLDQADQQDHRQPDGGHQSDQPPGQQGQVPDRARIQNLGHPVALIARADVEGEEQQPDHEQPEHEDADAGNEEPRLERAEGRRLAGGNQLHHGQTEIGQKATGQAQGGEQPSPREAARRAHFRPRHIQQCTHRIHGGVSVETTCQSQATLRRRFVLVLARRVRTTPRRHERQVGLFQRGRLHGCRTVGQPVGRDAAQGNALGGRRARNDLVV